MCRRNPTVGIGDDGGMTPARTTELAFESPEYPSRLRALKRDAPKRLWTCGPLPTTPAVSIVGTRRASSEAVAFTERLARELARAKVAIISGGAAGIDAAAHRGALEGAGATWVVHGTSLEALYPPRNRPLFMRILEAGGGWLSETPPGAPALRARFVKRNRIIAALSDLVVVVQAPARSGALSTARYARKLSLPVLAMPAAPWDPRGEGTLELIASGARMCRSSADVLDLLGLPGVPVDPPSAPHPPSNDASLVHAALQDGAAHVDALVQRTKLPAARVQVALIELALAARAQQEAGLWRAR